MSKALESLLRHHDVDIARLASAPDGTFSTRFYSNQRPRHPEMDFLPLDFPEALFERKGESLCLRLMRRLSENERWIMAGDMKAFQIRWFGSWPSPFDVIPDYLSEALLDNVDSLDPMDPHERRDHRSSHPSMDTVVAVTPTERRTPGLPSEVGPIRTPSGIHPHLSGVFGPTFRRIEDDGRPIQYEIDAMCIATAGHPTIRRVAHLRGVDYQPTGHALNRVPGLRRVPILTDRVAPVEIMPTVAAAEWPEVRADTEIDLATALSFTATAILVRHDGVDALMEIRPEVAAKLPKSRTRPDLERRPPPGKGHPS